MFKFTRAGLNRVVFIISIILFCCIQIFIYKFTSKINSNTEIAEDIMKSQEEIEPEKGNKEEYLIQEDEQNQKQDEKITKWQIEIPAISLTANISEGTGKGVLNKYVGHFEETSLEEGNVGLAAHNRGYNVNYFEDLKKLKESDLIIYRHNEFEMEYEVIKNKIITDTDWEVLENTEENTLTLITCVENEPNYRRCVQAVEIDDDIEF